VGYERERLHGTPDSGGVQRALLGSGRDDLLGGDTMIVWAVRVAHKRVRRQISCPCTACGTTGRNGKGGQCGDCNGTGRVDKWITEIVEE
jgi:hypothetical protein